MTTFVLSRTAAAAVTSPSRSDQAIRWNGFKAQGLQLAAANDNHRAEALSRGRG